MFFRRRSEKPASRGQALVETALLLPLLVLLLVMAIDFGRVFFGWVALQSAARVGADYAAQWSSAWEGMAPALQDKRDRYVALIEADARTINCTLAGGTPPDPVFIDGADTISPDGIYDDGDFAVVELECSFDLITPLAGAVFGGPIAMIAHEEFPIHRAIVQGIPDPPIVPECVASEAVVPDMVGATFEDALDSWTDAGFALGNFLPPVVSTGPLAGRNNLEIVESQTLEEGECEPLASAVVTVVPEP